MAKTQEHYRKENFEPRDIPGLISFWRFNRSGKQFQASQGVPYVMTSQCGEIEAVANDTAPLGGGPVLSVREGQWLSIPRRECPQLNIGGRECALTLVAWIRREKTATQHCEFIAGQWNEGDNVRQYGLFLNIDMWGLPDRICGHLSHTGGPTPGYKYCADGAMGATPVPFDTWSVVGMSYDGSAGYAWLNGELDLREGLNPYPMAGGLFEGGEAGSDFTVGAVFCGGKPANFFQGQLAGLAVFRRALTPAEMYALACR